MAGRRIDDPLWKSIIEETSVHFLAYFYPDAMKLIDFDREIIYLDKEFSQLFPSEEGKQATRYVDKLLKVFLRNGSEQYFLIHIEIQSNKGKGDLAKRMFQYFYRILDKYDVPITALAILADPQAAYRPTVYVHEFLGTRLSYRFNHYKILDQQENSLRADPNPFAVVILTVLSAIKHRHVDDEELKSIKLDLYEEMMQRKMDRNCRRGIYDFLTHYVRFQNKGMYGSFEKAIAKKSGRSNGMGTREYLLEQAKNEGREEGREEAQRMLENKIRDFALSLKKLGYPQLEITKVTGLSKEEVDAL